MRWSAISLTFLGLQCFVNAQTANFDEITSPTQDQNVAAGSSLDIVWKPSEQYSGTVTIQLLQGATPSTLSKGGVVAGWWTIRLDRFMTDAL